jgi:hypothetical protein
MVRTANDERSDSKNPNHPAYWASETNRLHQLGVDEQDDGVAVAGCFTAAAGAPPVRSARPTLIDVHARTPVVKGPKQSNLWLSLITQDGQARRVRVDAWTIDDAVADAKALIACLDAGIAYLALYGLDGIHLEETKVQVVKPEARRAMAALANVEKLLAHASHAATAVRNGLDDERLLVSGRTHVDSAISRYGALKAAESALKTERQDRLADMRARGYLPDDRHADAVEGAALSTRIASLAQWVRSFTARKLDLEPACEAFLPVIAINKIVL